jgi:transposase-like protein
LIDELLAGARTLDEVAGSGRLLAELTRRLLERAMSADLTDLLGYERYQEPLAGTEVAPGEERRRADFELGRARPAARLGALTPRPNASRFRRGAVNSEDRGK